MNHLIFSGYVLICIFQTVFSFSEGCESSITYFSKNEIPFDFNSIRNLVVFGDSLSSVDTNINDMTYTGKNHSLGDNWAILLSQKNNITLWNFAFSGAVIDNYIIPRKDYKISYLVQNQYFIDRMSKGKEYENKWNSIDTLFIYWFGTNDITYIDREKYKNLLNETYNIIVDSLFNTLDGTYGIGGRNFMFFNELPLDRFPNENLYNKNVIKENVEVFNERINEKAAKFSQRYDDVNVFVYNVNEELNYIIQNYKNLEFKYNNLTLVENEDEDHHVDHYIWVDDLHLSKKVHKVIADDIHKLLIINEASSLFVNMVLILINSIIIISFLL